MSFFTGKASKSSSSNTNNALVTNAETGTMNQGTGAVSRINSLLTGTGDTAAAQSGFQQYLQQSGFQPALTQGMKGITGQGAAAGLLQSGATAKALTNYGGQLDQQYFQNYLQNLNGVAGLGQSAAGLIGNVGQVSSGTGATPGLMGNVADLAKGIGTGVALFSDRRTKTNIRKIGHFPDGLGVYEYSYRWEPEVLRQGVMADEVARYRPWALGPVVCGLATVNYARL